MKKLYFLFILFFTGTLFAQGTERVLNVDDCVKLALNINHEVLINKESIALAEQRKKEARALHFPTMDFNFNLSRFSNDTYTTINSTRLPTTILLPVGSRDYFYSARLSLWQNIYNGGKTSAVNKLAKIHHEQALNNSDIKKNEVVANIRTQFYKNLATKEKISIYKKYIEQNKSELLQNQLEILEHQYEIDMVEFLALIGLELDTVVDLEGKMEIQHLDINLPQCLVWAYQFRPEIKNTQSQEVIDGISVNLISMEQMPTVMLGASYDWIGDDLEQKEKDWYISLNINIPIFDGGGIFSRLKQKKIKSRQTTIKRSQAEEQIKLQVIKAVKEYEFWFNKYEKIKDIKTTNNIQQDLLNEDIKYNYMKSLINLSLAVGK